MNKNNLEYYTIELDEDTYLSNIDKNTNNPIITPYINEVLTFKSLDDVNKCLKETSLKEKLHNIGYSKITILKVNQEIKIQEEEIETIQL